MKKFLARLRADERGLSLPEVIIAVGLTGLLALGMTQLTMASLTSATYTQSVAVSSLGTGTVSRLVTTDVEKSTGFVVSTGVANPLNCSTANLPSTTAGSVRPIFTSSNADGSWVGYEVRTGNNGGQLWRVNCPSVGVATGTAQILRGNLPLPGDGRWNNAVMCAQFPAGGSLTLNVCPADAMLNNLSAFPGIALTIPATVAGTSKIELFPAQQIVAARNVG
jgi:hypothetical protein